jgi:hypothetical protein
MAVHSFSTLEKGLTQATAVDRDHSPPGRGIVVEQHHLASHVDDLAEVEASRGLFASLLKGASFIRAEERGIERVKEEDRVKQSVLDGFTMWASANFTYVSSQFYMAKEKGGHHG